MNILKINCGLLLLDFLLKKSNHPTPNHTLKPVKYKLLRINERHKSQEKKDSKEKKNGGNTRAPGITPVIRHKIQHNSRCEKYTMKKKD